METILFYLLRVSITAGILFLFYKFVVSKRLFHKYNRIVILFFFVCSLILPIFSMDISWLFPSKTVTVPFDITQFNVTEINTLPIVIKPAVIIPWLKIITVTYFAGLIITLFIFMTSFTNMFLIIRKSEKRNLGNGINLFISDKEVSPFSWMKFLVITRDDFMSDNYSIIEHEKAHIQYHHSWDMLFSNVYIVLCWFNPFAWLLRKELQTIHEFQADEKVISTGTDVKEYQLLLIRKCVGENKFMLANNFEYSNLHKRIKMIMKTQTKKQKRWIYSTIPILLAAIVTLLSVSKLHADKPEPVKTEETKKPEDVKYLSYTGKLSNVETINKKGEKTDTNYEVLKAGNKIIIFKKNDKSAELGAAAENLKGTTQVIGISTMNKSVVKAVNRFQVSEYDTTKVMNQPLLILDGKEVSNEKMNNLKPEDIESVSVLKDKSAIDLYGDKGKNGVILISSKKATNASDKKTIIVNATGPISKTNSDVKTEKNIELKGIISNYAPLFIIDGVQSTKEKMDELKPEDIESISILKDQKNIELIYGEKAKDGVVFITTKKGSKQTNVKLSDKSELQIPKDALYVIDGKEVTYKEFSKLDPADIATIDVHKEYKKNIYSYKTRSNFSTEDAYKGESETQRYANKGKNGVIVVNTKNFTYKPIKNEKNKIIRGNVEELAFFVDGKYISVKDFLSSDIKIKRTITYPANKRPDLVKKYNPKAKKIIDMSTI